MNLENCKSLQLEVSHKTDKTLMNLRFTKVRLHSLSQIKKKINLRLWCLQWYLRRNEPPKSEV
jgi:hypothetical protein